LRIAATMRLCRVNGDCHTCLILLGAPEAGELLEHLVTSAHRSSFAVISPKSV
jgi:hypothetical protein